MNDLHFVLLPLFLLATSVKITTNGFYQLNLEKEEEVVFRLSKSTNVAVSWEEQDKQFLYVCFEGTNKNCINIPPNNSVLISHNNFSLIRDISITKYPEILNIWVIPENFCFGVGYSYQLEGRSSFRFSKEDMSDPICIFPQTESQYSEYVFGVNTSTESVSYEVYSHFGTFQYTPYYTCRGYYCRTATSVSSFFRLHRYYRESTSLFIDKINGASKLSQMKVIHPMPVITEDGILKDKYGDAYLYPIEEPPAITGTYSVISYAIALILAWLFVAIHLVYISRKRREMHFNGARIDISMVSGDSSPLSIVIPD